MASLLERLSALAARVGAEVKAVRARTGVSSSIALGAITVPSTTITSTDLTGIATVTRISAGRYRFTFPAAQADLNYRVFTDIVDPTAKFIRVSAKALANFEVSVSQPSLVGAALSMTAVDAAEVSVRVERKLP